MLLMVLLAVAAVCGLSRSALRADEGLRAEYVVANAAQQGSVRIRTESEISTADMLDAWNGSLPAQFRADWSGYLVVARSGWYSFATTSDDGSSVVIDGHRVVDNSGVHGPETRHGRAWLRPGSHEILIEYEQTGGGYEMGWAWAREDAALSPVPSWAVWTTPPSLWHALAARYVDEVLLLALIALGLVPIWGKVEAAVSPLWQSKGGGVSAAARICAPMALRVLLVMFSLGLGLAAAEGMARLTFRAVRSSGDARNYFAARSEPDRVNTFGFREVNVAAKGPRYRIAVIGDSITWGVGLREPERYSNLLQQSLGPSFEVLNFGRPGDDMPQHLDVLNLVLKLSPDFVLLQLYTNDFETSTMVRPRPRPLLPWRSTDRWLLRSSVFYTMLSGLWPQIQEKVGLVESYEHYMSRYLGDPNTPEARLGAGMLHEFIAQARAAGVPTGTVMFPNPNVLDGAYPFDYLHDRARAICLEEHVHCVDLRAPFRSHFSKVSEIVVSRFDGHPSAAASRVGTDAILAEFKPIWQTSLPALAPATAPSPRSVTRDRTRHPRQPSRVTSDKGPSGANQTARRASAVAG